MADIVELAHRVDENPQDHELRWQLAKKLYMARDYGQALDHLVVLDREWVRKINVSRYLAASHYRLGHYEQAIDALKAAVREWPADTGLREQLAHVLKRAGRKEEALDAWKEILEVDPKHNRAKRVLSHISKVGAEAEPPALPVFPQDSALGMEMAAARVCPNCGAQNSDEFDRCWKCHSSFIWGGEPPATTIDGYFPPAMAGDAPRPPAPAPARKPAAHGTAWFVVGVLATGVLLAGGAARSLQYLFELSRVPTSAVAIRTVQDLFAVELLTTRIVFGVILLVVWPVALRVALAMLYKGEVRLRNVVLIGLLLASAAHMTSWLPPRWYLHAGLALMFLSIPLVVSGLGLSYSRGIAVWALQGALTLAAALFSLSAMEGADAVLQFPRILAYARAHDASDAPGRSLLPPIAIPGETSIQWQSTGSSWLDAKAGRVMFEIATSDPPPRYTVEFKDMSGTLEFFRAETNPLRFTHDVVPAQPYEILLDGQSCSDVKIALYGLLSPAAAPPRPGG